MWDYYVTCFYQVVTVLHNSVGNFSPFVRSIMLLIGYIYKRVKAFRWFPFSCTFLSRPLRAADAMASDPAVPVHPLSTSSSLIWSSSFPYLPFIQFSCAKVFRRRSNENISRQDFKDKIIQFNFSTIWLQPVREDFFKYIGCPDSTVE